MALTINLPIEVEQAVLNRAQEAGMDVESFLTQVVAEEVVNTQPPLPFSLADFRSRLKQIIDELPASGHFVDDSRESIYSGRGE